MNLLLDTHIFLWYISADARLSNNLQHTIRDSELARGAWSVGRGAWGGERGTWDWGVGRGAKATLS